MASVIQLTSYLLETHTFVAVKDAAGSYSVVTNYYFMVYYIHCNTRLNAKAFITAPPTDHELRLALRNEKNWNGTVLPSNLTLAANPK